MDVQELRYFVAVAKTGSFSKAATKLRVAQPTLSRQVRKIEAELNATLFYRHGRGTALTDAGQELFDASQSLLQQLDDIKSKIIGRAGQPVGVVRLGVPQSIGATIGAPLAKTFHKKCPGARLHILEAFTGHLLEWVEAGTIDLAILNDTRRAQNMRVSPILLQDLFLIGTPGKSGGPKSISMEQLSALTLVLPGQDHGLRRVVDNAFRRAKVPMPDIVAEIDSTEGLKRFVEMGGVQTILPYGAVYRDVAEGRLTATLLASPYMRSKLVMATPFNKPFTKATRQLIEFVRQEFSRSVAAGVLRGKTFNLK